MPFDIHLVPADGHCTATEPQGRKYRKSALKWDANDGRPPDTVEALAVVDKEQQNMSKKKALKKKSMSRKKQLTTASLQPAIVMSPLLTQQALISYEWSSYCGHIWTDRQKTISTSMNLSWPIGYPGLGPFTNKHSLHAIAKMTQAQMLTSAPSLIPTVGRSMWSWSWAILRFHYLMIDHLPVYSLLRLWCGQTAQVWKVALVDHVNINPYTSGLHCSVQGLNHDWPTANLLLTMEVSMLTRFIP